jgi:ParB family transcriptional regulator, chromosome partitioning protein
MATKQNKEEKATAALTPTGQLLHLTYKDLVPNISNPRVLFDAEPLNDLKENIRLHGVLVPLVVFQLPGGDKYGIVDGARRHLCCKELAEDGLKISIPCNIVAPPTKVAGLLYMFNIHNLRQSWELMPTALGLQIVMRELGETDTKKLSNLTGLSQPQVERCKILIDVAEEFRKMSLDPNPKTRIPSNFWIEAMPVIDLTKEVLPEIYSELTKRGLLKLLVEKYRQKKIKSVIHFRRVVEAYENTRETAQGKAQFSRALKQYIQDPQLETRAAFDGFVEDTRKVRSAIQACEQFLDLLKKARVENVTERREELAESLKGAQRYIAKILSQLEVGEEPHADDDTEDDE